MLTTTLWLWIAFAVLLVLAGIRLLLRREPRGPAGPFEVDDDAIARIVHHGTLTTPDEEPLDEDEIARAEEEFWEQSWDEPDEYGR